jgi:alpha-ketoglutarate-dependent taurine dioxygenase
LARIFHFISFNHSKRGRVVNLTVTPLSPVLAARLEPIDLGDSVSDELFQQILDAFHRYHVLVFPGQDLSPEAHVAFSARFGELHASEEKTASGDAGSYFTVFGNVDPLGDAFTPPRDALDLQEWHSDHSHRPVQAMASMLYGRVVPDVGGETWFANLHAAFDALPDALRHRIEGRMAVHTGAALVDFRASVDPQAKPLSAERRAAFPEIVHPLVKIHPVSLRPALYFGSQIVDRIVGLSKAESRALIDELTAHVAQDRFVYRHKWEKGDLVFWDNRSVAHTGTNYDRRRYGRLMQRTTILNITASPA